MKNKDEETTPLRAAFSNESSLLDSIKDGLGAVSKGDSKYFHEEIRRDFLDSIDIDAALKAGREQENRWDYLLGHGGSAKIIAVEPHSAKNDEISTVIQKKKSAMVQLRDHLKKGGSIAKWLWVSSGTVHFANTEKARRQLDQNGIEFVGKVVGKKHLPNSSVKPRGKR